MDSEFRSRIKYLRLSSHSLRPREASLLSILTIPTIPSHLMMRLFLIPVARGRTLLFCKKLDAQAAIKPNWHDKLQLKTAQKWAEWEQADRGWKKHLVQWGDKVMQRVPFEEWGLKSVPPLKRSAKADILTGKRIELLYPKNIIEESSVLSELNRLATERQSLHRRRMWWSLAISPLTAPIAIIPL